MRMTNKIMQNNSLYNINNNKILQDRLSTQMSTQKKLTRPSDDPIIASRALRLSTNVSEIIQFKEKNAKDAESWLSVTGDALGTATTALKSMIKQMGRAANKDLSAADIKIIMEEITSLRDEIYATANVDYAGRYVFTGYRTDIPLSFNDEVAGKDLVYNITEQVKLGNFDNTNYTDLGGLEGLNQSNYNTPPRNIITEQDNGNGDPIQSYDIRRLTVSYDNLSSPTGTLPAPYLTYIDGTGTEQALVGTPPAPLSAGIPIRTISLSSGTNPYTEAISNNNGGVSEVIFIPETGEMLFSDGAYVAMTGLVNDQTEVRVNYSKDQWESGDLRPEHYFSCSSTENKAGGVVENHTYNPDFLTNPTPRDIKYDVGYNQTVTVNTNASDAFPHGIDRYVEDMARAVGDLDAIEKVVSDLKQVLSEQTEGTPLYDQVRQQLAAANKTYDQIREKVHGMFEHSIAVMQGALEDINLAVTDNGTRSSRLDLISNRLTSQQTTFEVLQSENENIDIAEVTIKLSSTELSYNAALMATGKIMQTSLLNYI